MKFNIRKSVFLYFAVSGDVSSLDSVRRSNGAQSAASTSADNSNSFSILTKEFLSKPDPDDPRATKNARPNPNNVRNLAPLPVIRVNGIENNLAETDDSDERQAYFYDKPKIPFESEDRESTNIQVTSTLPPKRYEFY